MKKLRDFYYDKNDIILAIVILVVAGLLITWRIDRIMAYPQTLAKETHTEKTTQKKAKEEKPVVVKEEKKDTLWSEDDTLTKDVTVTIGSGSSEEAVKELVDAGLFKDSTTFEKMCETLGEKVDNIKANTYTFTKGDTREDIVRTITK